MLAAAVIQLVQERTDFVHLAMLLQHFVNALTDAFCCPTQMHFQNLTDIHTRRHAQWVQHDVHRATICHIRHIFYRQNARYHAFIPVAARHFVARLQAAFNRDKHFHGFLHAGRQLVALRHFFLFHFKQGFGFAAFFLQRQLHQFKLLGDFFIGNANIKPIVAAG